MEAHHDWCQLELSVKRKSQQELKEPTRGKMEPTRDKRSQLETERSQLEFLSDFGYFRTMCGVRVVLVVL